MNLFASWTPAARSSMFQALHHQIAGSERENLLIDVTPNVHRGCFQHTGVVLANVTNELFNLIVTRQQLRRSRITERATPRPPFHEPADRVLQKIVCDVPDDTAQRCDGDKYKQVVRRDVVVRLDLVRLILFERSAVVIAEEDNILCPNYELGRCAETSHPRAMRTVWRADRTRKPTGPTTRMRLFHAYRISGTDRVDDCFGGATDDRTRELETAASSHEARGLVQATGGSRECAFREMGFVVWPGLILSRKF